MSVNIKNMTKNSFNLRLYFALLMVSVVAILASMPYAFTLAGDMLKQVPTPFPVIVIASLIQSSILFAIVLFLGMKLSKSVGLEMPIIEAYFYHQKTALNIKSIIKKSVILGIVAGIIIILLDLLFTGLGVQISLWTGQMPPFWMGMLASVYGGIGEEILLRLFFMTLIVWIIGKVMRTTNILGNNLAMWSAIIISAVVFGLGHLPITSTVTPLTTLVIIRAIILNGVGGVIFGWLYWKKGLESAMIAHFSADIVLHVLMALIVSWVI